MVEVCVPYEAEEQQGREKGSIDSYWFKQTEYTINMPNGKKKCLRTFLQILTICKKIWDVLV